MNAPIERTDRPPRWLARIGALLASLVLVTACASAPSPTGSAATTVAPATPAVTTPLPTDAATPAAPTGSPVVAPSDPRWEAVADPGDLTELKAALLGDGRALLMGWDVGGEEEEGSRIATLWDPATGRWEATSTLERPRTSFALIGLEDGRALVVGGYNEAGQSYSSAYAFDPRTETWTKVGVMDTARTNPAVAQLPDGRVLVAGGYFWQPPKEGRVPAQDATLAAYRVPEGSGVSPSTPPLDDVDVPPHGYALATAELFDPATGTFTPAEPMRYARPGASIATLSDGRVLVVGASTDDVTGVDRRAFETAEIYDPATGRFELTDALPDLDRDALEQPGKNPVPDEDPWPASPGTLVALPDGGALLIGHSGWWKHVGDVSRSFRLDAATSSWREIGETYIYVGEPTGDVLYAPGVPWLQGVLVAPAANDTVLVAGGAGAAQQAPGGGYYNDSSADASLFDPATDTWVSLPALPEARQGGVAVALQDGSVLLVGGYASIYGQDGDARPTPVRFVPGQ